jgi:serine/threonine protein phosphatase PrpC
MKASSASSPLVQLVELTPGSIRQLRVPAGAPQLLSAIPLLSPALAAAYMRALQAQPSAGAAVDVTVVLEGARVVQHGPPTLWAAGIAQRVQHGELQIGILRILRGGSGRNATANGCSAGSSSSGLESIPSRAMPTGSLAKILSRALKVGSSADRGGCAHMEDATIVHAPAGKGFAFCGVFDGHGGTHAALFCREHLHFNVMASPAFGRGDAVTALREGFCKTEAALLHEQMSANTTGGGGGGGGGGDGGGSSAGGGGDAAGCDGGRAGAGSMSTSRPSCCGSTALLLLLAADSMYLAWLGDCRAVLCRAGRALELTVDHSLVDPNERARALADGGHVEGNRLGGFLEVARALGDFDGLQGRKPAGLSAQPDVIAQPLDDEDEFLILGSDGLWGVVEPQDAVKLARAELDAYDGDATMASDKLVEVALKRHVDDNVSAMVICLNLRAREVEAPRRPRLQLMRPTRAATAPLLTSPTLPPSYDGTLNTDAGTRGT